MALSGPISPPPDSPDIPPHVNCDAGWHFDIAKDACLYLDNQAYFQLSAVLQTNLQQSQSSREPEEREEEPTYFCPACGAPEVQSCTCVQDCIQLGYCPGCLSDIVSGVCHCDD